VYDAYVHFNASLVIFYAADVVGFYFLLFFYGQNYTKYQWLIIYPNVSKNV